MANPLHKNTLIPSLLCLLLANSINSADDNSCVESSPCQCELNDNKHIDLTKLNKNNTFFSTSSLNLTYFFFPCRDVQFIPETYLPKAPIANNHCLTGASLCLYNASNSNLTNLGLATEGKFLNDFPKTLHFSHENVETSILLQCTPDYPSAYLIFSSKNNLLLFSSSACIQMGHPGLSIGSTILILFCTIFGVYLLGGAFILHCLRGARGTEMIPNLDFWSSIPGLVKDGTIFLLGGCNPMVVSSAETYDRI
ncbi:hypothetical protein PPYR_13537 [Photinus pyralis]|uniref:Cation-dependent mannose-6-phosphate receptor n=1 Tax=Photinus pyralis TaxID=7054 RepID=A0A1Y1MWM1_PHOPY|nr:cation-dependent mannose-6-phosphate receptor-like [Photinus pyralis]KAB0793917.1 hypothetical protein PPYR_13537 [Photinus pyralis]